METGRIAVIMPVRDVEPSIDAAMESLIGQSESRLEFLVGDDGSTDGTRDRLAAWARRDRRVRLFPGEAMGMVPTLNRLLAEARSPWIARMDGDDLVHRDRFAAQLALAAETASDATGCRIRLFPSQRVSPSMRRWLAWQNGLCDHDEIVRERYVETTVSHATLMVSRDRMAAVGGWRVFDGPEDLDLLLRLAASGARFAKVPRLHYFWRWHAGMSTRRDSRYRRAAFRRCKIQGLAEGPLAGIDEVRLGGVGRSLEAWKEDLEAAGYRVRPHVIDVKALRRGEEKILGGGEEGEEEREKARSGFLLLAFGMPRVRAELRRHLVAKGAVEERDFLFVA